MEREVPCALTIAGSDPSSGAGIQADLKTFVALGVYGACVVTAVTVQDTSRVYDIYAIPAKLVKEQIKKVFSDLPIQSVKIGMVYTKENVKAVADSVRGRSIPLVLDPVFRAGSGDPLIEDDAKISLTEELIPFSWVVTPNVREAEEICGSKIKTLLDVKKSAKRIVELGAKSVLIKGFARGRMVTDILYCDGEFEAYQKEKLALNIHGAGCTLSSAIAAFFARNLSIKEAVNRAEEFIDEVLAFSLKVGKGRKPIDQMIHLYNESEKLAVIEDVKKAVEEIKNRPEFFLHIADVGTQVAMSLPYPSSKDHVAAVKGRIMREERGVRAGEVKFGSSFHMANVILTAQRHDPSIRAAMNLRFSNELINAFRKRSLIISSFDRKEEPLEVKMEEGASLRWGIERAIKKAKKVPDVIFDLGEPGKEPMIRILGKSAREVVEKALLAFDALKGQ